jgi:hypothetical protein
MVEEAFDRRWIDFAKNQGKSTGGFSREPLRTRLLHPAELERPHGGRLHDRA